MIPDKSKEDILNALKEFDSKLRGAGNWMGWDKKKSQHWVIDYKGKTYPPKQILSLATGIPVSSFSGGEESNNYLKNRGFTIMPINSEVASIQVTLELIIIVDPRIKTAV